MEGVVLSDPIFPLHASRRINEERRSLGLFLSFTAKSFKDDLSKFRFFDPLALISVLLPV